MVKQVDDTALFGLAWRVGQILSPLSVCKYFGNITHTLPCFLSSERFQRILVKLVKALPLDLPFDPLLRLAPVQFATFLTHWVTRFGVSSFLTSDKRCHFESSLWTRLNNRPAQSTAYQSQMKWRSLKMTHANKAILQFL